MKKILIPVDFSPAAAEAVRQAAKIGACFDAHLLLLHVVHDPAENPGFYVAKKAGKKVLRNMEESAREMMDGFAARHVEKYADIETRVIPGLPAARIVELAEKEKVDLIAMGTRGRSGLERAMLGSVADKVIRSASCPVLTVREATKKSTRKKKG